MLNYAAIHVRGKIVISYGASNAWRPRASMSGGCKKGAEAASQEGAQSQRLRRVKEGLRGSISERHAEPVSQEAARRACKGGLPETLHSGKLT